jgi:hypothetical protein
MAKVSAGAVGFGVGSLTVVVASVVVSTVDVLVSVATDSDAFFIFLRLVAGSSSVDDDVAAASVVSALLVVFCSVPSS